MASSKPVILMVHGGWHPPVCYAPLGTCLEALGYKYICPQLPTLGPSAKGVTCTADIECIRKAAIELIDQGREVVVIGHSYGGVPACAATEGLDIIQRVSEGKTGGFRHLILLAAFAIPGRGSGLLQDNGGKMRDWQDYKGDFVYLNDNAKDVLYNDLPDAEAQKYFDILLPHSLGAFTTPVNFGAADITIPKTYILCEKDKAIPVQRQRQIAENIPGFRVERLEASHSPFLSRPQECAELIKKIVETDNQPSLL